MCVTCLVPRVYNTPTLWNSIYAWYHNGTCAWNISIYRVYCWGSVLVHIFKLNFPPRYWNKANFDIELHWLAFFRFFLDAFEDLSQDKIYRFNVRITYLCKSSRLYSNTTHSSSNHLYMNQANLPVLMMVGD
jgi:hypothetical protein